VGKEFDFRDMMGGANATLGKDDATIAMERDKRIGEMMVKELSTACIAEGLVNGTVANPEGVVGYMVARIISAAAEMGAGEMALTIARYRSLLDHIERCR
jgi:predicted transcriptional regulator